MFLSALLFTLWALTTLSALFQALEEMVVSPYIQGIHAPTMLYTITVLFTELLNFIDFVFLMETDTFLLGHHKS